ncbi:nucleoside diphosphate kinase, mitochondrial-like [Mustela lutreola]|uniref:nucleoside diphosphate kinase, mitochondrial-like n=1 Tax=Mustela lutreola TaxID=9666 RepID=UPI002797568C|nr:nucleoside diphosphate kinase, mitochondrial-like [Mustela lutreola]
MLSLWLGEPGIRVAAHCVPSCPKVTPGACSHVPTPEGPPGTGSGPWLWCNQKGVQQRLTGDVIHSSNPGWWGWRCYRHWREALLQRKPFCAALISSMSSWPHGCSGLGGPHVVCSRAMMGPTASAETAPSTSRGDISSHVSKKGNHASDSMRGPRGGVLQLGSQSHELMDWADEGH